MESWNSFKCSIAGGVSLFQGPTENKHPGNTPTMQQVC